MKRNKFIQLIRNLAALIIIGLVVLNFIKGFQAPNTPNVNQPINSIVNNQQLDPQGEYNELQDVALYIHQYGQLPSNFMTKAEARKNGWSSGPLDLLLPGKSIGGDIFGNNEKLLPEKQGRVYYECDIDTVGKKSRGEKRIVFSNDGLVYYTSDHYASFELLYERQE